MVSRRPGYGEPLSKHVKFADGEGIVASITTDPRFTPQDKKVRKQPTPKPYLVIVTAFGQVMRISLSGFRFPSTKIGRKYCRLRKGDKVVFIEMQNCAETMFLASKKARILHFSIDDIPILASAGKGVIGIRLEKGDEVIGGCQLSRPSDALHAVNASGKSLSFGQTKYGITSRGGKGVKTSMRTGFKEIVRPEIELVDWAEMEEE